MKRINTFLIVGLMAVMGLGKAQAQVVDVCAGNDTVELRLGNFQYGYVQWQVSDDNETWSNIDGAINTVYRFLPERPQYYRAEVRFPACSEYNYYSQVSYVQTPPKAFAGPDRTIPAGMVTRMNATHVDGAAGEWNIIEGAGGALENPNDCHSGFIGEEGEYKLTWTVTNSCGSNTDTVSVKCVRTEFQEDLVIVDETDAILSDSMQRLNGEYLISFNEPVPDIHEGSVLMGYMYPSFLRKVVSFEREGNLFTMRTEQGMLSDAIKAGVLNIDSYYFDATNGKNPGVKYLDRFPTRKEMQENPFLLRDGSVYVIKNDSKGNASYDFEFEYGFDEEGCLGLKLLEFDFKNLLSELDGLKYWFEVKLYPHFDAEVSFDDDGSYLGARIGFYDAEVMLTQHIGLSKPLTTTLVDKTGYFNKTPIFLGGFLIGLVPTFITLDLPYLFKLQASIEPPMSFTQTASNSYTYEITQRGTGTPYVSQNEKGESHKSVRYELPVGSLSAECNVGMMASVLVADVLGPYFEFRGNFDPYVCASAETGDIGGNINMGVDLRLGCRFQLFSPNLTLGDWNRNISLVDHNEPAPKKLFKYGGDNQIYTLGQYLEAPVSVKVNGWFNKPMPWAYVHFEPENGGAVSESMVATDIHGLASTRWKPGKQYGADRLKVVVYDCNGRPAGETPQFFHAYTSATDPCINANLTVEAYKVNENTIIPFVNGGKRPYKYSIDGENYSTTAPEIHLQFGQAYCFYVMDDNGCEAMAYYNGPSYDCESTTLRLNTTVSGNSVMATAMFGMEPYRFYIDGKDYHASSPEFGGLPMFTFGDLFDGEYMVRVMDHFGCEQAQQITISRTGNLAISLSEIENCSGTACVLTPTSTLIERGVCWSTHHTPTVQDFKASYGAGTGDFTFIITALDPDKTYYVRAYALDASGTSYSREVCINPVPNTDVPIVAATGVTNVGPTTASISGNVTYEGGSPVTERGICWGMHVNPTVDGTHIPCGVGIGVFSTYLTGLTSDTHYYVRAYATNNYGTSYGAQVEFNTAEHGTGEGNLVYNGDFELGNVGFETDYQYVLQGPYGRYTIDNDAYHVWNSDHCYGYGGSGLFMIVDGADYPNAVLWRESVEVQPYTLYDFSAQIVSLCNSAMSQAQLQLLVNGIQVGEVFHAPATLYQWQEFQTVWNSDDATTAVITIIDLNTNGNGNDFGIDHICFGNANSPGGDHEYVDLGLPSGTLWATCNVGANSPEEYGDYFAWGEIQPKNEYYPINYQYFNNGDPHSITKYCTDSNHGFNGFIDNLTVLLPEDDAATANWGSGWRMPTKEEWQELFQNTSHIWTTRNGVSGKLFTATNGNCLFLPAAGLHDGDVLHNEGSIGSYWSSSLDPEKPYWAIDYYSDSWHNYMYYYGSRFFGLSVRAVREN